MNYPKEKDYKRARKRFSKVLFIPEALDILSLNFSYSDYVNDIIALSKGIKQGFFEGIDDVSLSSLLSDSPSPKPKILPIYNDINKELYSQYYHNISELALEYENSFLNTSDISKLDSYITKKMIEEAQKYIENESIFRETYGANLRGLPAGDSMESTVSKRR